MGGTAVEEMLSSEQIAALHDMFSIFDKDGDGSITELQLGALLRSLSLNPDATQVKQVIQQADSNRNGLIEFDEFVDLVGPEMASPIAYNDDELISLFKAFDRDGNGFITAAELAHSMAKLGHPLSVRELSDMIREADADGDGRISFPEFASALTGRTSKFDAL